MATAIIIGTSIAACALVGRALLKTMASKPSSTPHFITTKNIKYYKGGFDSVMTKREAGLILGIKENSQKDKIKEAHRRIMLLNHPDRNGSPYLATKINEAKDLMEGKKGNR